MCGGKEHLSSEGSQALPARPSEKDGKLEESLNCAGCITNGQSFIFII
jgi:hypothetical protein